jgi:hypothetical protein
MPELIISGASGDYYDVVTSMTWPTVESYANRHGKDVRFYELKADYVSRPPAWSKLVAISDAFAQADAVLWIDADVVISKDAPDIFQSLDGDAWQAMVCHKTSEGEVPNTGVWLLQRTMLPFLMSAAMSDAYINHRWWEQAAILKMMGFAVDGGPCRNMAMTPLMTHTQWLDESWNVWSGSPAGVEPKFRHACGMGADERIKAIKEWADAET